MIFLNLAGCPSVCAHLVTFWIMTLGYRSCVDPCKQKAMWRRRATSLAMINVIVRPKIVTFYFLSLPFWVGRRLNAIGYTGSWLSHATSLLKTCIFHTWIYFDLALWNWHRALFEALTMQNRWSFRQHILVPLLKPREWHLPPPDSTVAHSSHPIWLVPSWAVAEWLVLMQQLLGWRLECS